MVDDTHLQIRNRINAAAATGTSLLVITQSIKLRQKWRWFSSMPPSATLTSSGSFLSIKKQQFNEEFLKNVHEKHTQQNSYVLLPPATKACEINMETAWWHRERGWNRAQTLDSNPNAIPCWFSASFAHERVSSTFLFACRVRKVCHHLPCHVFCVWLYFCSDLYLHIFPSW